MELGKMQSLTVVKQVDFGVYLADADGEERVLLPLKQVPEGTKIGDRLTVFLYKDSSDRLIATTTQPKLMMGGVARLKVAQTGKIGAFLDWGLEKDLFLPFKEQTKRVEAGEECLVAMYADKSGRLCATMNVYPYLSTDSPYQKEDQVEGTVYETSRQFGVFVAVDDRYSALIPKKELYDELPIGSRVRARVAAVKPDGKLDLSIREKAYLQIDQDVQKILDALKHHGGKLPFNDKADPERIRAEMHMSKNEFKRAVGRLLKERKIRITENSIIGL